MHLWLCTCVFLYARLYAREQAENFHLDGYTATLVSIKICKWKLYLLIYFFSLSLFYLKIFRHFIVNSNTPYKPKWKAKMGTKNRVESTTTNGEQRKKRCCANIKEQIEHVRIQILHFPLIFFPFIVDLFFQL